MTLINPPEIHPRPASTDPARDAPAIQPPYPPVSAGDPQTRPDPPRFTTGGWPRIKPPRDRNASELRSRRRALFQTEAPFAAQHRDETTGSRDRASRGRPSEKDVVSIRHAPVIRLPLACARRQRLAVVVASGALQLHWLGAHGYELEHCMQTDARIFQMLEV